jgi:thymidylate kinase
MHFGAIPPPSEPDVADRFFVVLGTDFAGKSSVMAELARTEPRAILLSTDQQFVGHGYELISRLRRDVVEDVLPALGLHYSAEFLAGLLQLSVLHLRDRLRQAVRHDGPVVVDSYYYKILAKCRLNGLPDNAMFSWWRSFPRPRHIVFLDVSPETAWRRSVRAGRVNAWEHYGPRPDRPAFERFQRDLKDSLVAEIAGVPTTVITERDGVPGTAAAVREVLHRG